MELLLILILWPGLSIAAGIYAARVNRSGFAWFCIALLLSPLLAAGRHEEREPCPRCAELIKSEATRCPFCRTELTRDPIVVDDTTYTAGYTRRA